VKASFVLTLLVALALTGLCLRVFISWHSIGSNDAVNWYNSAQRIEQVGLVKSYAQDKYLNNPPLISLLVVQALKVSRAVSLPFPFLLRLPGIIGEVFSLVLIVLVGWRHKNLLTGLLWGVGFSLNPLSILVTGFHGHTDGLCGAFLFLAFYLWHMSGNSFGAGFALGAAMNVKLIPLAIFPALFFAMNTARQRVLVCAGLAVALLPFLFYIIIGSPAFYERVFSYRSILDYWGFQTFLLILKSQHPDFNELLSGIIAAYHRAGPFLILGIITAFNYFVKVEPFERAALSFALMAVFAPGFGITYPAIAMPIFCVTNMSWAFKFSIINALALVSVYTHFLVSTWPWQTVHVGSSPRLTVLCMFIMWIMLMVFIFDRSVLAIRKNK
jgi:hypothetical protein